MQTCIRSSSFYCHSLSLAPVKSRLVLPFWYRLTRVVSEKGPLNECMYSANVLRARKAEIITSKAPVCEHTATDRERSAVVERSACGVDGVDDGGGEGGGGEAGVRLPAATSPAVAVVGDAEHQQTAGHVRRAVHGVDHLVQTAVVRRDVVTHLPPDHGAVLTNGHTGHVPRAPDFFCLFEGPPTGCGEIIF